MSCTKAKEAELPIPCHRSPSGASSTEPGKQRCGGAGVKAARKVENGHLTPAVGNSAKRELKTTFQTKIQTKREAGCYAVAELTDTTKKVQRLRENRKTLLIRHRTVLEATRKDTISPDIFVPCVIKTRLIS